MSDKPGGGVGAVLREIGLSLSDLLGGGRLDANEEISLGVLFGLLGALARADSIVTSHETDLVNNLLEELKLSTRGRALALTAFERGRRNELTLDTELERFLAIYPRGSTQAASLYDSLVRLANADGRIRPREREYLQELTVRLGYDPALLEDKLRASAAR
jgi:tellurite resistance protein